MCQECKPKVNQEKESREFLFLHFLGKPNKKKENTTHIRPRPQELERKDQNIGLKKRNQT